MKYFFKLYLFICVLCRKQNHRKKERQKEGSSICWFTPHQLQQPQLRQPETSSQELFSRSPTRTEGPKDLNHTLSPSEALSMELDQKQSSQNTTGARICYWNCRPRLSITTWCQQQTELIFVKTIYRPVSWCTGTLPAMLAWHVGSSYF